MRKQLGSCLVVLSQEPGDAGNVIRKVIEEVDFDIEEIELKLDASIRPKGLLEPPPADTSMSNGTDAAVPPEDLDAVMKRLSLLGSPVSCLSHASGPLFEQLCELLLSVASEKTKLLAFDSAPLLGRAEATSRPFYLSFYMRVWMGHFPTLARAAALGMAKGRLGLDDCAAVDFQAVFPYCIAALADPARKVRRAAADLLSVLGSWSKTAEGRSSSKPRWGAEQLYEKNDDVAWLSPEARDSLLHTIVLPSLEESVLHEDHLSELLQNALNSPSGAGSSAHLSHSSRLSIMSFLASHAIHTPLLALKTRLLRPLNQVRGVSNTSRTQLLLPILQWWASLDASEAQRLTSGESLDEATMDSSCVDTVIPNDKDGLDCFFRILKEQTCQSRAPLLRCVFARIRKMWPSLKSEWRSLIAREMLLHAQNQFTPSGAEFVVSEEAAELLRNVSLSTEILADFLESLRETTRMATDPQSSKRRRTSSSENDRGLDVAVTPELRSTLSKMTFVLQLVEGSGAAEHLELLPSLFTALSDILALKSLTGSELAYLQNIVLGSLLAMVPAYRNSTTPQDRRIHGIWRHPRNLHTEVIQPCRPERGSPAGGCARPDCAGSHSPLRDTHLHAYGRPCTPTKRRLFCLRRQADNQGGRPAADRDVPEEEAECCC